MKHCKSKLRDFLEVALITNVSYHAARRELLDLWFDSVDTTGGDIDVPSQVCIQIRSFLQSRGDQINNDNRLAFETALVRLSDLLQDGESE